MRKFVSIVNGIMLGVLGASSGTPANASNAVFCNDFATKSVVQYVANIKGSCGLTGIHWSPLTTHHRDWCASSLSHHVHQVLQQRNQQLMKCGRLERRLSLSWSDLPYHTKNQLTTELIQAIRHDDIASVMTFEREGVDLNFEWQMTRGGLLYWAISSQATQVVRYLIDLKQANPNLSRNGGPNPIVNLLNHVPNVDYSLLRYLLQHGAKPNHGGEDFSENTIPLLVATANNDPQSVAILLEYKANPNLFAYIPPLMMAVDQGNAYIVDLLLKAGASPNVGLNHLSCQRVYREQVSGNYLPVDAAIDKQYPQIISLIRSAGGRSSEQCRMSAR